MTQFKSFVMAGFECATGRNRHGRPMDQVVATQHDKHLLADYDRLTNQGIYTVREGVRWPVVDRAGAYDLSSVAEILRAANEAGVELVYDLFHYGYPEDLDIFGPEFVDRFEDYCYAVARFVAKSSDGPHYFTPVNEPSYLAYCGGEACLFGPHACGRGPELKLQLARAAIRGIEAIWNAIPDARIVNVDPICRVVPPRDEPDLAEGAHYFNEVAVFESFDMISGRLHPELGGSRKHLDIVGLNYYWTNQWEHTRPGTPLDETDERLWPIRDLVRWVWHRYGGEICITETSHTDDKRGPYLRSLTEEAEAVLFEGIPLVGVCLYPVLGMPEWHDQEQWTRLGLWDLSPDAFGNLIRVPHEASHKELEQMHRRLELARILKSKPSEPRLRSRR